MLRLHRITKTAASVSRARLKLLMWFAYEFKVREVRMRMRMMSQGLHQPSVSHLLTGIMERVTGWFCLTCCCFIVL